MIAIGIVCAGDRELEPFLSHIQPCSTSKKAMLTFYEGTIHELRIVTLYSGVCKTNAAIATQILIDTYHVDIIINAGTAEGMSDEVHVLDTIISTEVAHHDVHDGILTEFHPWIPSRYFKADEKLLCLAKRAVEQLSEPYHVWYGRMVTGESFIDMHGRDEINTEFMPLTVDMETASIAQVCYVNSTPFIAIRTVTDTAAHSGESTFDQNCAAASTISKEIVLALLDEIRKHY